MCVCVAIVVGGLGSCSPVGSGCSVIFGGFVVVDFYWSVSAVVWGVANVLGSVVVVGDVIVAVIVIVAAAVIMFFLAVIGECAHSDSHF